MKVYHSFGIQQVSSRKSGYPQNLLNNSTIMFSTPFKYLLLVAVAIGQVFGGMSCCCFGRMIESRLGVQPAIAVSAIAGPEGAVAKDRARCPRCMAKDAGAEKTSKIASALEKGKRCGGPECRCSKQSLIADTTKVVEGLLVKHHECFIDFVPDCLCLGGERATGHLLTYAIPLRHGGNSWQSVACVWRI